MSNYTTITDFSVKDALSTGNPSKIILGSEIDAEFDAVASAITSKVDAFNSLSAETSVVSADALAFYDDSGGSHKKITFANFLAAVTGSYVGSFTRDVSLAGSTQAITGVGFTPSAVFLLANVAATGAMSVGIVEGVNNFVLYDNAANSAGTYNNNGTNCILLLTASSQAATASLTSMDADGFTVTWAKSGSPTGTATVRFLALQ
jgi:hypothetical protein